MLVYRKLDDVELKYNREFFKHYVATKCFIRLIAKIARDILELITLIFFHVKCLSICIPKNLTDSSNMHMLNKTIMFP